ncbi:MAG: hypothetical protein ABJB49_06300 [Nitrospirota bacterium]
MKFFPLAFVTISAALPAVSAPACTNTPLSLTFNFAYTDPQNGTAYHSAIYSDGTSENNPPYVDGTQGVSAIINCTSNDLVLSLSSATRKLGFNYTNVLWTNNTPAWVTNALQDPFYSKAGLTIRNLMYAYNQVGDYTFTTRLGSPMPAPDGKTYYPRMVNPSAQAYTSTPEPSANYPDAAFTTSLVQVHHTAASPGIAESWIIYPDSAVMGISGSGAPATQVLSLLQSAKNSYVNVGQFSMPFYILVTRK